MKAVITLIFFFCIQTIQANQMLTPNQKNTTHFSANANESRLLDFEQLNRSFQLLIQQDVSTQPVSHKIPDFFVANDLINLNLLSTTVVEDLRAVPTKGKFSTLSTEEADARNAHGLKMLAEIGTKTKLGITKTQALDPLKFAHDHPVVGIDAFETYDPNPPNLPDTNTNRHGFCFGRADFIYYELLKMGISKNSILKIFQIGAIYGDPNFGRPWSNHIVTIVRANEGGWYALDPFYNELMSPEQWVAKNRSFAQGSRFITLAYVGRPTRMYSQGGMNTAQAIADDTYPSGRDRAAYLDEKGVKQIAEANFVFKDASFRRYYNAMIKDVLERNTGKFKNYFCSTSQLCENSFSVLSNDSN